MNIPVSYDWIPATLIDQLFTIIAIAAGIACTGIIVFLVCLLIQSERIPTRPFWQLLTSLLVALFVVAIMGGIAVLRYPHIDQRTVQEVIADKDVSDQAKVTYGYTVTKNVTEEIQSGEVSSFFYEFKDAKNKVHTCELVNMEIPKLSRINGTSWHNTFLMTSPRIKELRDKPVKTYPAKLSCDGAEPPLVKK